MHILSVIVFFLVHTIVMLLCVVANDRASMQVGAMWFFGTVVMIVGLFILAAIIDCMLDDVQNQLKAVSEERNKLREDNIRLKALADVRRDVGGRSSQDQRSRRTLDRLRPQPAGDRGTAAR